MMGCGEQVTNWHYFIQSSFALHSLHFELFLRFFGLFIVSSIFATVFSHRPCPKVHSSPVHDFMMHFHNLEGFARRVPSFKHQV